MPPAVGYVVLEQLPPMTPWMTALTVAAVAVVVGKLAEYLLLDVVSATLAARTETDVDDRVISRLHLPVSVTVVVVGLYLATYPLQLPAAVDAGIRGVVLTVVTVLWAWAGLGIGHVLITASQRSDRFEHDFGPVFENLWTFTVILGGVFALLAVWRVDITPLLASAGIAGVAVGFAAKDTVANFFGGIALYFDNTYKVGDYVVLDTGEEGTVEDVGIRSTVIRTRDDTLTTVPNGVLNNARITNESMPDPVKRITVPVGVGYGTDIDELEELLLEVAADCEYVVEEPAPATYFKAFGDSALQYELRCWVPEPTEDVRARDALNRAIYRALDEAGIVIPYPQRTVHMEE